MVFRNSSTNMRNYHLQPVRGRWKLKSERSDVIFAGFDSRSEALEFCAGITRQPVSLTIHRPDGSVIERMVCTPPQAA